MLQNRNDSLKSGRMGMDLSHKVFIKKGKVLIRDSFQQLFLHLFRKVVPRIFKGKPPRFQDFGKLAKKIGLRVAAHGGNGSVFKGTSLFGITRSTSNSICMPSPIQSGQAPYGALKEKRRGSISGREMLQSGQANFSL